MQRASRIRRALGVAWRLGTAWLLARLAPIAAGRTRALLRRRARALLEGLGGAPRWAGATPGGGPLLVVANHVSWLDVCALVAVYRARPIVASHHVRRPLLGVILRALGAVAFDPHRLREVHRAKDRIAAGLRAGDAMILFPELRPSRAGAGRRFHPALFQAAIDAGARVQAVALRYVRADDPARETPLPSAAASLPAALVDLLCGPPIQPVLLIERPLPSARRTRGELAAATQALIAEALAAAAAAPASVTLEPPPSGEPPRRRRALSRLAFGVGR